MATVNQFYTDIAFHPGETLAEKLKELNMGPKEFALRTEKPEKTIIAIINGESAITAEIAIKFEAVLKIPARLWIKKQQNFDEYKARQKAAQELKAAESWAAKFPIADMVKCGWLAKTKEKAATLLHFFGVSSPKAWNDYFCSQQLKIAFRISLAHTKEPYAVSAWIRQGEIQAQNLTCGLYSESEFKKSLLAIKAIMAAQPDDFFEQLQNICLACGVKVVYTPCIKKAPLSGATRWISDNPLIQLTGRYKINDKFWFTFFHEAGHILLHGKKDIFLEDIEYSEADIEKENEANAFAEEWTFSKQEEQEVLAAMPLSKESIKAFAVKFNTHPAMIIGRLQKKRHLHYAVGKDLFVTLAFKPV